MRLTICDIASRKSQVVHRTSPPFRGEHTTVFVARGTRAARVSGRAFPPHTALPMVACAGLLGGYPFEIHPVKTKLIV